MVRLERGASFHPQKVFFANLGVNRLNRLCGAPPTASLQSPDFLGFGQKSSFLNWKRCQVPIIKKNN